jgi:hypothetical protein
MRVLCAAALFLRALLLPRLHPVGENLALRQQLGLLEVAAPAKRKSRPVERPFPPAEDAGLTPTSGAR